MKNTSYTAAIIGALLLLAPSAWALPTNLTVRVRAHDAKFVGTGVGDVQVTVKDFNSREILASGFVPVVPAARQY